MRHFETMQDAVSVARLILAGEIEPNVGCGLIAAIGERIGYPSALLSFTLLGHEQFGHEGLGITAEACVPHILEACHELVATHA